MLCVPAVHRVVSGRCRWWRWLCSQMVVHDRWVVVEVVERVGFRVHVGLGRVVNKRPRSECLVPRLVDVVVVGVVEQE